MCLHEKCQSENRNCVIYNHLPIVLHGKCIDKKERTTAGSDYWIIIISLCHHNRERKDVCMLPLAFFFMLLLFIQENDRIQTRPIANG